MTNPPFVLGNWLKGEIDFWIYPLNLWREKGLAQEPDQHVFGAAAWHLGYHHRHERHRTAGTSPKLPQLLLLALPIAVIAIWPFH